MKRKMGKEISEGQLFGCSLVIRNLLYIVALFLHFFFISLFFSVDDPHTFVSYLSRLNKKKILK